MRLSPREEQVLHAAIDRILPPDDHPGAWDAGALESLTRQLDGDLAPLRALVLSGLAGLDAESEARHGRGFVELPAEDQDALLGAVETGTVRAAWTVPAARFFDLLVRTTAEGFYGDPAQGGNRDRVSWAMTGFDREPE